MCAHATPEPMPHLQPEDAVAFELPIRRIFREVVADRVTDQRPPHAALLFDPETDPAWTEGLFLGDFYNAILHQDTCQRGTADGIALLAVLAVDDRVPAKQRFEVIHLLVAAATVGERHLADAWPHAPPHADPDSEARARAAVETLVPELLARWPAECVAIRLALAALAVVFPTDRTFSALTSRLQGFADQYPPNTDIGDYVRFVVLLATRDEDQILTATETLTDAYWRGTPRQVPTQGRALHLLGQMLDRIGAELAKRESRA